MKSVITIAILLMSSASAFAQDTGETTREVVGVTNDGKVVVRAISQGERIVKGASKSYYFELDEVWDPRLSTAIEAHRRGEPTGYEHPGWKKASSANLVFNTWAEGQASPDGKHLVVTVIGETKSPGNEGWVCTATARTIVMSREAGAAFNAAEKAFDGEPASREGAATCPKIKVRSGWSKDAKLFVVERVVGDEFGVVSGSTDSTGSWAESPMRTGRPLDPLGNLAVGPLRDAWEALLSARPAEAQKALAEQAEETGWSKLAAAWVAAKTGDEKAAQKAARKVEREVKGDPIGLAMLGGAYALAGDNRRTKKALNDALKAGKTWQQYVQMALLLEDVDLSLFNQVLVYGLSTEDGKANAAPWAWRLLIDGLADAGIAERGEALLERIPAEEPARAGAEARLAVGAGNGAKARERSRVMLWGNIGNCDAYLLAGRAELLSGAPAAAIPLLNAATFCDGRSAEGWYFLSELHRAAGRTTPAVEAAKAYLEIAPARRNDAVRDLRRDRAQKAVERLSEPGIGLVSLACRRLGPAFLCQGVVVNASDAPIEGVAATIKTKKAELGKADLPAVPPGETRSFGIRVETLEDATFSVGRDEAEQKRNEVINLGRGW